MNSNLNTKKNDRLPGNSKKGPSRLMKFLAVALTTTAFFATTGASAQEAEKNSNRLTSGETIESILVDLGQSETDLLGALSSDLTPRMKEIRDNLKKSTEDAIEILKKLKQDPSNENLKAEYEDVLSKAFTQGYSSLETFVEAEPAVKEAIAGFKARLGDAIGKLKEVATTARKESQNFGSVASEVKEKLQKLAAQYEEEITNGRPIPPEIDKEVRFLQSDIETAMLNEKITTATVRVANNAVNILNGQSDNLNAVDAEVAVSFHNAKGQKISLQNLARLKQQDIKVGKLKTRIAEFCGQVGEAKGAGPGVGRLIDRLVATDYSVNQGEVKSGASGPQYGRDILKSFLPNKGSQLAGKEMKGPQK